MVDQNIVGQRAHGDSEGLGVAEADDRRELLDTVAVGASRRALDIQRDDRDVGLLAGEPFDARRERATVDAPGTPEVDDHVGPPSGERHAERRAVQWQDARARRVAQEP